jgi:hypothetical protein
MSIFTGSLLHAQAPVLATPASAAAMRRCRWRQRVFTSALKHSHFSATSDCARPVAPIRSRAFRGKFERFLNASRRSSGRLEHHELFSRAAIVPGQCQWVANRPTDSSHALAPRPSMPRSLHFSNGGASASGSKRSLTCHAAAPSWSLRLPPVEANSRERSEAALRDPGCHPHR